MEIFIFWIILSVLVGVFASSRGRSGIGHFFIALLLSPLIGALIILVLSQKTEKIEERAINNGNLKKCPSCAELVKNEAIICKHCNRQLPPPSSKLADTNNNKAADGIEW